MDASLVRERVVAILSSVFGALALLLGCIGLYGTLAYRSCGEPPSSACEWRSAPTATLVRTVIGESLRPVAIGIVAGLPLALAAGRGSESLLFGISGTDPMTYAVATMALLRRQPARHFCRPDAPPPTNPIVALRSE